MKSGIVGDVASDLEGAEASRRKEKATRALTKDEMDAKTDDATSKRSFSADGVAAGAGMVVLLAVAAEMFHLPFRLCFEVEARSSWDVALEGLFLLELVGLFSDWQGNGWKTVKDREKARKKAFMAVAGLLGAFPFETLSKAAVATNYMGWARIFDRLSLRWIQLLRVFAVRRVMRGGATRAARPVAKILLGDDINPALMRLLWMLTFTLYQIHCMGCFYYLVVRYEGFPDTPWATVVDCDEGSCNFFLLHESNKLTCYLRAVFWAWSQVTGIGGSLEPETTLEISYSIVAVLLGVATNMIIFSNIANLIASLDEAEVNFQTKMERIEEFAKARGLHGRLKERVKRYHQLSWERKKGANDEEILSELPTQLRVEVCEHLFAKTLQSVGIFKHLEPQFIKALSTRLRSLTIAAGEFLFLKGDLGAQMFFIADGEVQVILDGKVLTTMGTGSYFGEIALLTAERRTASIRCVTDCEFLALDKDDLEEIVEFYPRSRDILYQIAKKRRDSVGKEKDDDIVLSELPLVKNCPLFQNCSQQVASAIVKALKQVTFNKGEIICKFGEVGKEMYFILEGSLDVYKTEPERFRLATLQEGQFFGEVALTSKDSRRTAEVVAATDCVLLLLSKTAFIGVMEKFPVFHQQVSVIARVRSMKGSPHFQDLSPARQRWALLRNTLSALRLQQPLISGGSESSTVGPGTPGSSTAR